MNRLVPILAATILAVGGGLALVIAPPHPARTPASAMRRLEGRSITPNSANMLPTVKATLHTRSSW